MKRTLILDLGLFERRCGSVDWSEGIVFTLLRTLAYANLQALECVPGIPPLYKSRVRYKKEPPDKELFGSCLRAMKDGHADCEDLAAWRIAELWRAGEEARFVVKKATLLDKNKTTDGRRAYAVREEYMVGDPGNRYGLREVLLVGRNKTLESMKPGQLLYHILVRRADGSIEDPSAALGMGKGEIG